MEWLHFLMWLSSQPRKGGHLTVLQADKSLVSYQIFYKARMWMLNFNLGMCVARKSLKSIFKKHRNSKGFYHEFWSPNLKQIISKGIIGGEDTSSCILADMVSGRIKIVWEEREQHIPSCHCYMWNKELQICIISTNCTPMSHGSWNFCFGISLMGQASFLIYNFLGEKRYWCLKCFNGPVDNVMYFFK